ncbi:MAG: T9SS type A sorting domain-containing protein [Crocinitomicaceae bacterium]
MKNIYVLLLFAITTLKLSAQDILLINDNDNISQNTDTFLLALQNSNYSTFTFYNHVDSSQMPTLTYLNNFDILIYYASTDGGGLGLWDIGQNGNNAIRGFLANGGRGWFIGTDLLFAGGYSTPSTFTQTSFAYEFLGLESYDSQSYGDDGNMGVSNIYTTAAAPTAFPSILGWTLGTLWWVDGVTSRTEATNLYEMGPSNYPLYQAVCMTHFRDEYTNALSSFFDPALILGHNTDRVDFINESLDYLWPYQLSIDNNTIKTLKLYPTIASDIITVKNSFQKDFEYEIINISGQIIKTGSVNSNLFSIPVSSFPTGIYFLKVGELVEKFIVK